MDWPNERYVRLYTRDTVDWLALSLEAQGLLGLLLRKADRSGIIELGRLGRRGVALAVGHPTRSDAVDQALGELLDDGCIVLSDNQIVVRNFLEAQEATASDKLRQRESRERRKSEVLRTACHEPSQAVTGGHVASQPVTSGHSSLTSQPNQPSQPCCAEPAVTPPPKAEQPPPPVKTHSLPAAFFARVQGERVAHGLVAERPPRPEKLAAWYSEALGELGGDEERLWATYERYSEDKYWATTDPPWPIRGFLTQWRDHVPRRKNETG